MTREYDSGDYHYLINPESDQLIALYLERLALIRATMIDPDFDYPVETQMRNEGSLGFETGYDLAGQTPEDTERYSG
jgi:hypothetical protein